MKRTLKFDERASAAVEFALVVPVLFMLILGIISLSTLYFSQASMHQAAERTARYWAVSDAGWSISSSCTFAAPEGSGLTTPPVGTTTGTCDSAASGFTKPSVYARANYNGAVLAGGGPTFTPTTGVCSAAYGGPGVIVAASGTYQFNVMFVNFPVNLSAQACYPLIQ